MAKTRSKLLKDGKLHFYTGNKKATEKEAKQFINTNYKLVSPDKLDKDLKTYLGRVKGGKARYENSLTDKSGKYLPTATQKRAFKLIDIEKIKEAKGLHTIRDVFRETPELQKQFDKIINQTGVYVSYNTHQMFDKIKDYKGKTILINGKEVSKNNARKRLRDFASKTKRLYGAQDASLKFTYIGVDKLSIDLPTEKDYENFPEYEDFNENFEGDIMLYVSEPKKKESKKRSSGKNKPAKKTGTQSENIDYAQFKKNVAAMKENKFVPKNHKPKKKKK